MKAPGFWYRPPGLLANLLTPLGWCYAAGTWLIRVMTLPWRAPVPVICVGNLTAGGAGKTPVAIEIARRLQARGFEPHFVSGGYGGKRNGPVRVEPGRSRAADVGDEPLLLARIAPTWVAKHRAAGARLAVAAGADIIIMDDGFQNPTIAKDLSLLVVDGGSGFGNGRAIPAGPLREPVSVGLKRARALVVVGPDAVGLEETLPHHLPVLRGGLVPGPEGQDLAGRKLIGFAGIGRPDKFRATLLALGAQLLDFHAFPDHYRFSDRDAEALLARCRVLGARPVTTEKDAVRLPPMLARETLVLPVSFAFNEAGAIERLLSELFNGQAAQTAA